MTQFPNLELTELFDLLARQTQQLTELFTNNCFGNEYDNCKKMIEDIQAEIILRKNSDIDRNRTQDDIQFLDRKIT